MAVERMKEFLPYPKTKQTGREPKPKKSNKATGTAFEKKIQKELKGSKRNNQATPWGGCSNPDLSFGDFNIEVKSSEDKLCIPEWTRKVKSETPKNKKPGLVYKCEGDPWISVKLEDRKAFAEHIANEDGGFIEYPDERIG